MLTIAGILKSTLFAATAAQLLGVIISDTENLASWEALHPRTVSFLFIASYGGVMFNAGATIAFIVLLNELATMPLRAAQSDKLVDIPLRAALSDILPRSFLSLNTDIFRHFGVGQSWSFMILHCP